MESICCCNFADGQPLCLDDIEKDIPVDSAQLLTISKWTFMTQEVNSQNLSLYKMMSFIYLLYNLILVCVCVYICMYNVVSADAIHISTVGTPCIESTMVYFASLWDK